MSLLATGGLLDEPEDVAGNSSEIALAVRGKDAQQALASLLGQIGLLENTLGRVNVRQVESRARVARVKDGSQPDTSLKRSDHDPVHLIVGDVTILAKVNGIDDFVEPVRLVAVEVSRLTTMP
jgi:hypothetical protein